MTLDEYIASEYERLEKFRLFWLKGFRKEGPDVFPTDQEGGEWDEQYLAFDPEFLDQDDDEA